MNDRHDLRAFQWLQPERAGRLDPLSARSLVVFNSVSLPILQSHRRRLSFKACSWLAKLSLGVAAALSVRAQPSSASIARVWDEEILAAIRIDLPNPPVHARNLFHLSAAIYDAWAAYDPVAVGYLHHGKSTAADVVSARREAISYAAYRVLVERYSLSRNAAVTLAALAQRMAVLGYATNNLSRDLSSPAGLGNQIAASISAYSLDDGCLQAQAYRDLPASEGGYVSVNPPLITGARGTLAVNINRWQPLIITNAVSQNNIPVDQVQKFLGAQWLAARPFSLARSDASRPWFDPGPPPYLGGVGDAEFRDQMVDIIRRSSELTPDDGATIDISPGSFGNNSLGQNDGHGHALNPATGTAYPALVVKRGDFARALAEFWADGPNSETPPGHWNTLANWVSDQPSFPRRLAGTGPSVDPLEWDVKVYFALNGALHDAACAAWSLKRYYDGYRPVAAIRYMAQLGQSTDPKFLPYHQNGLPLVPGLIELVTPASSRPGQRHAGLPVNTLTILAWPGEPPDPGTQSSGVRWIVAADWLPYQKKTFVTPAFPGYISGHSTFSRAAAEVLTSITGSPFFPGGLCAYPITKLGFEQGPSAPLTLQWATYYDAADQAGLSRLWGGIHVSADDLTGRRIGSLCGQSAWRLAQRYFSGAVATQPPEVTILRSGPSQAEMVVRTLRGFLYGIGSGDRLDQGLGTPASEPILATDSEWRLKVELTGPRQFYRVWGKP